MKTLILAGGFGTRLASETESRPKPMVEIGGRPLIWHIMSGYAHHGFRDFVVALGHRGDVVREYFGGRCPSGANTVDGPLRAGTPHGCDRWSVDLVETGIHTETAGRMTRARDRLGDGTFMMTYGDGVADVPIDELVAFHRSHGRLATVTAVHPVVRFGLIDLDGIVVTSFHEKAQLATGWVNGGFFVLEPGVFDFIDGDVDWSRGPLDALAAAGELCAYRHEGFWRCLDNHGDKSSLQGMWDGGNTPWVTWE